MTPRVLVVEDEPNIRELVCLHLGLEGYACEGVGDGREALRRTENERFDLLVLDVMIPSLDGLSLREEGYTEGGGGNGFDLHVSPYYANSLRGFAGVDLRQDIKIGDSFLQPEIRGGYRYDFMNGAAKTTANFAGAPDASPSVPAGSPFTIKGPDATRGNFVAGGGIATTTNDWSIGLNYDVQRGTNGDFSQVGTVSLIGRI